MAVVSKKGTAAFFFLDDLRPPKADETSKRFFKYMQNNQLLGRLDFQFLTEVY